jgi:hypothetical protein
MTQYPAFTQTVTHWLQQLQSSAVQAVENVLK